jgi:puromycin-sensitive aminopeptidase
MKMIQPKKIVKNEFRLSRQVLPSKYQISIKPDLESATFQGEEVISLKILKPTKKIILHSRELEIVSAEYESAGKVVWAGKVSYKKDLELAILEFKKLLTVETGKLSLTFRGLLNNQMRGFYRSRYTHKGQDRFLSATQFEATDARMAFPCFDEPNMKAVFEVALQIPSGHEAVSNTLPASVEEHEGGFKTVRFAPTPRMSTYLLAFVSGELEYLASQTKSGVAIRVYTPLSKKTQGKYALEVAVRTVEFFEKYFKIKYPLPTLDMVAIPDFASQAMENWGLITFRESAILTDEHNSSLSHKQWVALVVAHEIAHQWFGNLVTMEWWTHLWLNEGFASYIEYLAVDHLFPKWDIWTQFLTMDFQRGMAKDGLLHTHPIEVDVHDPNEIDEIFDDISYRKGSSIIRMLADYLGERSFRLGLQHYLEKHKYKNATTDDLWESLEKVSKKPVKEIMSSWTRQAGLPLVSVSWKDKEYTFSQERFFRNPSQRGRDAQRLWPIPFSILTDKKDVTFLLKNKTETKTLSGQSWLKFNRVESAFVRVNAGAEYWKQVCGLLKDQVLSTEDRWGIVNNLWALAEAGYLETSLVLELSMQFRRETHYPVWSELLEGVLRAKMLFGQDAKNKKAFENYIQLLLEPTKKRLGLEQVKGESHGDALLRPLMFRTLGLNGDEQLQEKALQLLTKSIKSTPVPTHIKSAVYTIVASVGDRPEYDFFKQLYIASENSEERGRITQALCGFSKSTLLGQALKFSLSGEVRDQDRVTFNRLASGQAFFHERLWEFTESNWKKYKSFYGHGGRMLNYVVASLANISDERIFKQMEKFFKANAQVGLERTLNQTLEMAEINVQWRKRDESQVTEFLKKYL